MWIPVVWMFILDLSQQEVHWQHRWIGLGAAGQVVSMNLILYGSLVMVAYSKPWRAMVCNFLDMTLGRLGTRYPRYSEIRRFTRTRENEVGRSGEAFLFFWSGEWWFQILSLLYTHSNRLGSVMIFNPSYFSGVWKHQPEMTYQETWTLVVSWYADLARYESFSQFQEHPNVVSAIAQTALTWWFWPHFQVGASHGDNPKR